MSGNNTGFDGNNPVCVGNNPVSLKLLATVAASTNLRVELG